MPKAEGQATRTAGGLHGRAKSGQFRNDPREPLKGLMDLVSVPVQSHETVSVSSRGSAETKTVSQIPINGDNLTVSARDAHGDLWPVPTVPRSANNLGRPSATLARICANFT